MRRMDFQDSSHMNQIVENTTIVNLDYQEKEYGSRMINYKSNLCLNPTTKKVETAYRTSTVQTFSKLIYL